jgi:hypothetical protein
LQRDRHCIADRDARQALGRGLINRHHHDFITSFQQGQRLALDVPDALKRKGAFTGSISRMLRYIESF